MQPNTRHWPAEWEQQQAILLAWPHRFTDWADPDDPACLTRAEAAFIHLVEQIADHQRVIVVAYNQHHRRHIESLLDPGVHTPLTFVMTPTNDTWTRDFGPVSVQIDQAMQQLDFVFNGWGNKYAFELDDAVNQHLAKQGLIHRQAVNLVLEGGSIDSNGQGVCLTTKACLLNPNRNPDLHQQAIEQQLQDHLGVHQVIWLDHGFLVGDDTDSHIDNLARFVSHDTIVYAQCNQTNDPAYLALQAMQQSLQATGYRLQPLPLPAPVVINKQQRPASYVNFLITNKKILVPQFDDPQDSIAIDRLQSFFPERQAVGIPSRVFVGQNGGVHCLTMNLF